jgi:FkbM family methyltransferase
MTGLLRIAIRHYREDRLSTFFYRLLRASIAQYSEIVKWLKLKLLWLQYGNRCVVRNVHGDMMWLSLKDKGISSGLMAHGYWEPLATKILNETVQEGDIVVDIGANMGYFVLQESKLVGKSGKVFAIEPVAANIELLRKNLQLNYCSNVETFQLAVGATNDEQSSIYLSYKLNCGSMVFRENINLVEGAVKKVPVSLMTLDRFLENKPIPNFIRMDVEGYEFEIIQGMKGLLARRQPLKLLIEIHPAYLGKENLAAMLDLLKQYGFLCGVAVDRQLDSKSRLLQKAFYFLSDKMAEDSSNGFFYRNGDLDKLKSFGSREMYPHVLFVRQ